ncbi:nucleotidyltransferase family protein [Halococcoides cellulosivorans]|uniref:Nucleotidyltransferase family protein n=1 Tax=Halococcoides cellulosivorans TaxID=1679096 RepID=A0A2R4WY09_9EURY|nr:nucleotidyltransferase family protein [Halococcoides cellulosivorans]AWB26400.1 hypothetical protein HARCEL1_01015 [Halococcoides cellulosivorans]
MEHTIGDATLAERGYAPESAAIAGLVDPAVDRVGDPPDAEVLRANKLSLELLPEPPDEADDQAAHRRKRRERFQHVCELLNDAGVAYASMKNLRTPSATMSDVDLLVPDPREQALAARVLAAEGFEFYGFRLLAHPRKVMAKRSPADPRPVDIYPDAMWIRKVVCDAERVVERANADGQRTPAPADDLYLVATHAYSHCSITFAELYHGVAIVDTESVDWAIAIEAARSYGCVDALYAYLLVLDEYLTATGRGGVPDRVFDAIPRSWITRLVDRWFERSRPRSFPVVFPTWLPTMASAVHHVPRVARQCTTHETLKDFQSHGLTAASKVLLGEA